MNNVRSVSIMMSVRFFTSLLWGAPPVDSGTKARQH